MQCANCGNCSILNKQQAKLAQNFLSEAESQFCDCKDYSKENFGNTKFNEFENNTKENFTNTNTKHDDESSDELSSSPGGHHKGDLNYTQTIKDGIKEFKNYTSYYEEELPSSAEIKQGVKESLENAKNYIPYEKFPTVSEIKEYIPLLPMKRFELPKEK